MSNKPVKRKRTGKPTVQSAVRTPQNHRSPRPAGQQRDEDMLSEFSDDYNTFYVDERYERRERARKAREVQKKGRQEEKRKPVSPARRKLIRVLSYAAIIAVVLIVGIVLSLTVLFKTQVYEVIGNTVYPESDIIDACGISEGENIFLAPKGPAEKRIKSAFPYVEEVKVGFRIPDAIKIEITEAVEGYLVKVSDAEYLVISTKGRILSRVADQSGYDLPIFIGPKLISGEPGDYVSYEDETVVSLIDSITQSFADNGYQGITEVDATNTAEITFTYDNRIKVKLGIPEDLDYKIRTAMTIIQENLDKNQTGTTKGILDVSRCNSTKRSYFNEQEINPTQAPTQDPSQPATEADTDEYIWWTPDDSYVSDDYDLGYDYYDEDGYGHYW